MTKGQILTEGELRRLAEGSLVYVIYTSPNVNGRDYEGPAEISHVDDAVIIELTFTTLVYELTGDDTVAVHSFSDGGDTIKLHELTHDA